jgi:uncharacterized membrane protein
MDKLFFAGTLLPVFLSTLAFVGSHFIMSHPLRGVMVRTFGEGPFAAIYSGISAAFFGWMIIAYYAAPLVPLWEVTPALRWVAVALMLPASVLFVLSLTPKNPTLGPRNAAPLHEATIAAFAITRHPMLSSFTLWAIAHILANGDAATLLFAGGIALLSFVGGMAIDAKKKRQLGAAYEGFLSRTSYVPFLAILRGRARLNLGAIGLWRLALGIALYGALLFLHPYVFGVAAWPPL